MNQATIPPLSRRATGAYFAERGVKWVTAASRGARSHQPPCLAQPDGLGRDRWWVWELLLISHHESSLILCFVSSPLASVFPMPFHNESVLIAWFQPPTLPHTCFRCFCCSATWLHKPA